MADGRSVRISDRAARSLQRTDARLRSRLGEAVRELTDNPLLGKKLKGPLADLRSYRIGPFRIVYRYSQTLLDVVFIDDRKDVYR